VELFRAERIAVFPSDTVRICRACGAKLTLVRTMVDTDTGYVIHMFECRCGERTWDD
jgi:hypothetical protein